MSLTAAWIGLTALTLAALIIMYEIKKDHGHTRGHTAVMPTPEEDYRLSEKPDGGSSI